MDTIDNKPKQLEKPQSEKYLNLLDKFLGFLIAMYVFSLFARIPGFGGADKEKQLNTSWNELLIPTSLSQWILYGILLMYIIYRIPKWIKQPKGNEIK